MKKLPETSFSAPEAQPYFHQGGEHGVVLLHGFTGSCAHMRLIAEALAENDFTVRTFNLPGHATRMEDMRAYRWTDWLDAARSQVEDMRSRCRYVSVAGLSMGGVMTLLLAAELPLTAAVPISAPMAAQNRLLPFAKYVAPLVPIIAWGHGEERLAQLDERYNLGYAGFPTRSGDDLHQLIRRARAGLSGVTCPLLVVQSHGDETIAPASADIIMQGVSSRKKRTLWLDGVPHVCTISPEHGRIAQTMTAWLRDAENA